MQSLNDIDFRFELDPGPDLGQLLLVLFQLDASVLYIVCTEIIYNATCLSSEWL